MRACPKSNFISHSTGFCWLCRKRTDCDISSNTGILFEQIKDLYYFAFISLQSLAPGLFGQLKRSFLVAPLSLIGCGDSGQSSGIVLS
jgi:hypothetical protein